MRFFAALALLFSSPLVLAQSTATYRVTFESTWSAETHPDGFPGDPHYSGLIGGTHDASAVIWSEGAFASPGIEAMAEAGAKTLLRNEVEALIADGRALAVLSGGGIGLSPGSVSLEFEATEAFSRVTLVSMLAPSPDWFIGVAGLDLRDGTGWTEEITVPLVAWDAGTDSGTDYGSPDLDTDPADPIAQHTDPPFLVNGSVPPIGTMTFTRLNVTDAEGSAAPAPFALTAPAPNPATTRTAFALHLDASQHVRVEVFDVLGRRVATLHDGALPAGVRPFSLDVRGLSAGLYFARAQGNGVQATRRFVVR